MNTTRSCRTLRAVALRAWMMRLPLLLQDLQDPFAEAADERFRVALSRAIEGLPERERLVMSLYYSDGLNLKEIGAVLKVTESRVCQLHGQALVRLKARLADWRDGGSQ